MLVYTLRRLGQAAFVMAAMAVIVFFAVQSIGNPVDMLANPNATEAERAQIAARLGLDKDVFSQFLAFAGRLLSGDFGSSFVYAEPAIDLILKRLPATLELAGTALIIALIIGVPLGLFAGLYPDSFAGRSIMGVSILGFSLPNFWIGLMLILLFAVELRLLPASGRGPTREFLGIELSILTLEGWRYLVLPAITLALYKAALVIRIAQAGTREVMLQDYVRFARAKGLKPSRIVGVHVLKNILIPVVTVLGLELGSMIAFAVVTESVFSYPGMGKLLIDSIGRLDRPIVVAYLMLTVAIFVVINLMVDLLYAAIDPRVRLADAKG